MSDVTTIFNNPLYTVQEKTTAAGNSQIDKEAFLKLLTAQLKYQDPLNPMDNTEFVGQLAMFSALEQVININNTLEQLANSQVYSNALMIGSTIIGKTIVTTDGTEYKAQGIAVEDGVLKINTGEQYISMNQIKEIKA